MGKLNISAVFNRQNKLKKNGTAQIEVCACLDGKRKYFGTGICVKPETWDKKKQRIKSCAANAIQLNKQVSDLIQRLENCYIEKTHAGKPFSLEHLTELMQGKEIKTFTDFVRYEIETAAQAEKTKAKINAHATIVNKRTTFKALCNFQKVVQFDEVNFDFLKRFENHLIFKGLGTNTINKYFRHIRGWQNSAINKDYFELNKYAFRKFKAPTKSTTREYLEPSEILRIENLEFAPENRHLQKVKDMFLFACYTGLRFSDISAIQKDCIKQRDGGVWLEVTMQKTNENIKLPLYLLHNGKPTDLLKKYEKADSKYYFDELTNQYVNRCLKEIATLAGINKCVTFHTARHTTATFLLYKGVAVTTVQKILGHKKLQTTQIYSKVMDLTLTKELQQIEY
ncbi:tyrosine recombinase [Bacteroidia bacterium]|nr:tyrosine recombinase [Bacteroidia bacterium]